MSASSVTVSTPTVNRKELAEAFGQNQSAIRRLEAMTKDLTVNIPGFVNNTDALTQALAQIAYIVKALDPNAPNAVALTQGTGLTIAFGAGTVTISLAIPVSVQNGGTGLSTLPPHNVLIGNDQNAPNFAPPGAAGQVLMSNGLIADPSFQATVNKIIAGAGVSVSSATGNVTVSLQATTPTVPAEFTLSGNVASPAGALTIAKANQNANTVWAGPLSGAAAAPNFRALGLVDLPNGYAWSNLGNPSTNTTLNFGANTTTFNSTLTSTGFSWQQSTAATASANQNSMALAIGGTAWNGTASVNDVWTMQAVLGAGSNPASLLTFAHSGSSGAAAIGAPMFSGPIGGAGATPAAGMFTQVTNGDTNLMRTSVALANGAAAQTATLTNGPTAGNPTKWIPINDNGTTRYIPAW